MKIRLGKLARWAFEATPEVDVPAAVHVALRRYVSRLDDGSPPIAPPPSARDLPVEPVSLLDVPVSSTMRETLESEARKHSLSFDSMTAHAVLVYLAEIDAAA